MNRITLITEPDDLARDAFRILCVDLNTDQTQIVSDSLTAVENELECVVYVWNSNDSDTWLFDKKQKSNLIIFNACSYNSELVGYLAAQPNSLYFGPLKFLSHINDRDIYDVTVCKSFLIQYMQRYEQIFK